MAERDAQLEALQNYFSNMEEEQVDEFLGGVGSTKLTRSGWNDRSEMSRWLEAGRLLGTLDYSQRDAIEQALIRFGDLTSEDLRGGPDKLPTPVGPREEAQSLPSAEVIPPSDAVDTNGPIFVVHGRDHTNLHLTVRVLERATSREVVVLHEQANAGRTVLEKFEQHAGKAAFAVVLLTGDDEGALRDSSKTQRRARQNVIFELGFFFGKLRRERVAVLIEDGVERPSDVEGLVYITLDRSGAWKQTLARELGAAGISVNYGRIP